MLCNRSRGVPSNYRYYMEGWVSFLYNFCSGIVNRSMNLVHYAINTMNKRVNYRLALVVDLR